MSSKQHTRFQLVIRSQLRRGIQGGFAEEVTLGREGVSFVKVCGESTPGGGQSKIPASLLRDRKSAAGGSECWECSMTGGTGRPLWDSGRGEACGDGMWPGCKEACSSHSMTGPLQQHL